MYTSVSLATLASFSPSTNRLYSSFSLAASVSLILSERRGGGATVTERGDTKVNGDGRDTYLWMVAWRVSTLAWQRSRVRLVMLTLMESMHTLSTGNEEERKREREGDS